MHQCGIGAPGVGSSLAVVGPSRASAGGATSRSPASARAAHLVQPAASGATSCGSHAPHDLQGVGGERGGGGGTKKRERVGGVGSPATRSHGLRRVGRRAHVARSAAHTPKSALHHTLTHLVRGTATASASCHGSPLLQPRRAPRPSRRADPPRRGRTSGESCSPPPSSTASARRAAA